MAAALGVVVHSVCHLCLVSSSALYCMVLLGIRSNAICIFSLRAAPFASLSANSFPIVPAWALTHDYLTIHPSFQAKSLSSYLFNKE